VRTAEGRDPSKSRSVCETQASTADAATRPDTHGCSAVSLAGSLELRSRQLGGHRSDACRAGAGADEQNPRVKVRTVSFRMTLVPSPIAKNALVNEGEGVRFVSHTEYDAGTGGMLTLRKYNGGFGYMAAMTHSRR